MKECVLTSEDLAAISGGGWDWEGFFTGLNWALGIGCGTTGNPVVCGTWLASQAVDALVV